MIVIAFKNKISGKSNYLTTRDYSSPCTITTDNAMKFGNMREAMDYYTMRYSELKARSNIYKWKKEFGINIDKPYFIEIEKEEDHE